MSIKTDGVVSGIATTALIKELSTAASRPKTLLETKVSQLNTKNAAYTQLNTMMTAVKTSLTDIQKVSNFRSFSTSVPSAASSYFSATANGSAIAGTYSVQITDMAKSDMHILGGLSSSTASIKAGTITITASGSSADFTSITLEVSATTSSSGLNLGQLASALNAKAGISAYVLNDGSGGTDAYKLVVLSEKTGEDHKFSISYATKTSVTGTSGTDLSTSIANKSRVTGQNATAKINGVDVESSTNVFTNAVSGLTITALGDQDDAGVAAQDVAVTLDTSAISTKINTFVNSYNSIIDFYTNNNKVNSTTKAKGVFVGDSNVRNMVNQLRNSISTVYDDASFTNANSVTMNETSRNNTNDSGEVISPVNALSKMGITFNSSTGKLKFSSSNFTTALLSQQLDVEAMFADQASDLSFSAAAEALITTYTTSGTGTIATIQSNTTTQIKALTTQIERWEKRITSYEARLYKQFTAMEKMAGNAATASSFLGAYFAPKTK